MQTRLHFGGIAMISASATNCAAISSGSSTNRQRDQKEVDGGNMEPALVQKIGEMGNPLPVRLLRLKLAIETGDRQA